MIMETRKQRTKRAQRACTECRMRKIRCVLAPGARCCDYCHRWKIRCKFRIDKRRRMSNPLDDESRDDLRDDLRDCSMREALDDRLELSISDVNQSEESDLKVPPWSSLHFICTEMQRLLPDEFSMVYHESRHNTPQLESNHMKNDDIGPVSENGRHIDRKELYTQPDTIHFWKDDSGRSNEGEVSLGGQASGATKSPEHKSGAASPHPPTPISGIVMPNDTESDPWGREEGDNFTIPEELDSLLIF